MKIPLPNPLRVPMLRRLGSVSLAVFSVGLIMGSYPVHEVKPSHQPNSAPAPTPLPSQIPSPSPTPTPAPPPAPSWPPAQNPAPGVYLIPVPWYRQIYSLDCESGALQMVLAKEGIHVSQDELLADEVVDRRAPQWDAQGHLHWGDPYTNFVGDPNGLGEGTAWGSRSGYGVYWPMIAAAAREHGGNVIEAGEGISPQEVYRQIEAGHPVQFWGSYDWRYHAPLHYIAFDGRTVIYGPGWDHSMVVSGVSNTQVRINDPIRGQYWVSRQAFEAAYASFDDMAVVLG